MAKIAEERGEHAKALDIWRALASESDDPAALCHQGRLCHQLGYTEESHEAYKKAIRVDPSLPRPYVGLAIVLMEEDKPSDALALLAKALTLEKSANIYALLGAAFMDLDRNSDAAESLKAAIQTDPLYEEAYFNLGVLTRDTDRREAEQLFSKAIELDPDYAVAHRELGWVLNHSEPSAQAEYHLRRAVELNPTDAWARVYLGNLLWARGDIPAAIAEFEQAIKLMPNQALPLWSLANVFENQERWKEAEELYGRAVALDPEDPVAHMNFGRMLKKKGDHANAEAHLKVALSIDPEYEKARELLADLQRPNEA
jgi:tetratricopeptide (TPR) repeat protein